MIFRRKSDADTAEVSSQPAVDAGPPAEDPTYESAYYAQGPGLSGDSGRSTTPVTEPEPLLGPLDDPLAGLDPLKPAPPADEQPPARNPLLQAEADAALDHALREGAVEAGDDEFYDDSDEEYPDHQQPANQPPGAEPPAGDEEGEAYVLYSDVRPHLEELAILQADRQKFIELILYARDRVTSPAAADRIDAGLRELGIEAIRPDGERFDPSRHEAAATVPTDDPEKHGLVAETETLGYSDRGHVVRPPIVTVYRVEKT